MIIGYVHSMTTTRSLSNANRLVSRADKRVIAHYYSYRCAYITTTTVAAIELLLHECVPAHMHTHGTLTIIYKHTHSH